MVDEMAIDFPANARLLAPFSLGIPVEVVVDGLTASSPATADQPVVSAEGKITVIWDTGSGKAFKL